MAERARSRWPAGRLAWVGALALLVAIAWWRSSRSSRSSHTPPPPASPPPAPATDVAPATNASGEPADSAATRLALSPLGRLMMRNTGPQSQQSRLALEEVIDRSRDVQAMGDYLLLAEGDTLLKRFIMANLQRRGMGDRVAQYLQYLGGEGPLPPPIPWEPDLFPVDAAELVAPDPPRQRPDAARAEIRIVAKSIANEGRHFMIYRDPAASDPRDCWLASSPDGVFWSKPVRLGRVADPLDLAEQIAAGKLADPTTAPAAKERP